MLRCHFFFAITLTHINTALGTRHFTNCTTRLSFARSTTRRSMDRLFDRSSRAIVRARIFEIERAVNQNGVICKVDELHQIYNICVNHFFFSFFLLDVRPCTIRDKLHSHFQQRSVTKFFLCVCFSYLYRSYSYMFGLYLKFRLVVFDFIR